MLSVAMFDIYVHPYYATDVGIQQISNNSTEFRHLSQFAGAVETLALFVFVVGTFFIWQKPVSNFLKEKKQ
jgi:hypothetical protein